MVTYSHLLGIGDALRKRQEHGAFVISLKESFLQNGTSHATEFNPLVTVMDPSENEVFNCLILIHGILISMCRLPLPSCHHYALRWARTIPALTQRMIASRKI